MCTPRWRVVILHVNEGYFYTPPEQVTSPTWGLPPPCKQALSEFNLRFANFHVLGRKPFLALGADWGSRVLR